MPRPTALLAVTTCLAGAAIARTPIEFSADGHRSATPDLTPPAPAQGGVAGAPAPGTALPYGLAPDWQNAQRRQIGGLAAADMNGDGLTDIVVGCYNSSAFPPYEDWRNFIHFNTGSELEATPSWISSDQVSTLDVRVGDINLDGSLDIFAATGGTAMSPSVIYFGGDAGLSTTPGWFSSEPDDAFTTSVALFDIDNDGDLDALTTNQGNSQFDPHRPMFFFRNHAGMLETTPSWQSAEQSIQSRVAIADYDNDGRLDAAVSKWVNFESGIYRNTSGTLATTPVWTTGDDGTDKGIAWGDVDGDGDPDLAIGRDATDLFINDNGSFTHVWSAKASFFGQEELRFEDVDHDGDPDLAEINFSNGHARIYLNDGGELSQAPSWQWDAPGAGNTIAFGDINGDGMTDLIVGTSGDPSLHVFYNQLAPSTCPADFTGDGTVNAADLAILLGAWNTAGADLTGDETTNAADLALLLGAWGECR